MKCKRCSLGNLQKKQSRILRKNLPSRKFIHNYMTKFFSIMLVVLGISTAVLAQTEPGTTQFGINVGLNAATAYAANSNADARVGINAGISVEHYFTESWSFKAKALYDQKGWNNGYVTVGDESTTTNFQTDYFTVPLLAGWHFGRTKNWYLNFGPFVSFLTKAKETALGINVKDAFNKTDAGLDLGIGVKFPVTDRSSFFIEFNGEGGLANVNSGAGSTVRSSVSAFNVGLNF